MEVRRIEMTKKAFNAIREGLEDAIAFAEGDKAKGRARKVKIVQVDVAALRRKLKLTQKQFAKIFGVSLATLRNWEQGRRKPEGPAMVLLNVIKREPEAVLRALGFKAA
jgi:putative transcriptional regulator